MNDPMRYQDWHIPFREDQLTLRQAHQSLKAVGEGEQSIPLMVQLVENPKFRLPGVELFHGRVDLEQHDYIHLVLARGLLPKDEAFAIGFTMGSTNNVSATEELLFSWISKNLYPNVYRFGDEEIKVFRDALRLGFISQCRALDSLDFNPYLDMPLVDIRTTIGLEADLITAYYGIEKRRFPYAVESQRLV